MRATFSTVAFAGTGKQ